MIKQTIMREIIDSLSNTMEISLQVCDTSGNICISTNPSHVGHMNLLAIEALNANSKVTNIQENGKNGAAIPLIYESRRIGALVLEDISRIDSSAIEILKKSIEWIYAERLSNENMLHSSSERDQFLFEWLHCRDSYSQNFIERGMKSGINIEGEICVVLVENNTDAVFPPLTILQNIAGKENYVMSAEPAYSLVIFRTDSMTEQKMARLTKLCKDNYIAVSGTNCLLYTAYIDALSCLRLGKSLFPGKKKFTYEQLQLALSISKITDETLGKTFELLITKGQNAHLDETVIAYLQYNGDIAKVCDALHIHRNSIQYRIKKIAALCGRDLGNYYDLLYLYASYISYTLRKRA